jgi:hypothetical protein
MDGVCEYGVLLYTRCPCRRRLIHGTQRAARGTNNSSRHETNTPALGMTNVSSRRARLIHVRQHHISIRYSVSRQSLDPVQILALCCQVPPYLGDDPGLSLPRPLDRRWNLGGAAGMRHASANVTANANPSVSVSSISVSLRPSAWPGNKSRALCVLKRNLGRASLSRRSHEYMRGVCVQ